MTNEDRAREIARMYAPPYEFGWAYLEKGIASALAAAEERGAEAMAERLLDRETLAEAMFSAEFGTEAWKRGTYKTRTKYRQRADYIAEWCKVRQSLDPAAVCASRRAGKS